MERSEAINELATALSKAQGEMKPSSKSGTNPFFKHSYATFDDVLEAVKKPLADNGLSFMQMLDKNEDGQVLISLLMHGSGQWISSTTALNAFSEKGTNALQDIGKAITYMKRYALSAMLGVSSDEDDDGNSANGKVAQKPAQKQQPKQQPPAPDAPPVIDIDDIEEIPFGDDLQPEKAPHWIDDPKTKNGFWAWVGDQGLSSDEVYRALAVEGMHDFPGTIGEAKMKIHGWAAVHAR